MTNPSEKEQDILDEHTRYNQYHEENGRKCDACAIASLYINQSDVIDSLETRLGLLEGVDKELQKSEARIRELEINNSKNEDWFVKKLDKYVADILVLETKIKYLEELAEGLQAEGNQWRRSAQENQAEINKLEALAKLEEAEKNK